MLLRFLIPLLGLLGVTAVAQSATYIKVGMVTREYKDDARQEWEGTGARPLTTVVWYPAAPSRKVAYIFEGPVETQVFDSVPVAPDVDIARTKQKYPLVLLSHGTGSSAQQLIWLGYHLASRGYIAAAVNHHGNSDTEKKAFAQGAALVWERPKDLSVVLDRLLADPTFGQRIDADRIGAAGFSLGGYSVIALGGGRFSPDTFAAWCKSEQRDVTCEARPALPDNLQVNESISRSNDSYRDPRIKGVFAIAPVLAHGFTQTRLTDLTIPVRIVVGEADTIAPMQTNAVHYAQIIPQAQLSVLHGDVGHYEFMAACTAYGRKTEPVCKDAAGVNRVRVHREVANMAYQFFEGVSRRATTASLKGPEPVQ
jgi:predicted dienelactone hydrolase